MTFDEYHDQARQTMAQAADQPARLAMTALGLVGEAGECSEIVKKHLFHGHVLDQAAMAKELGDVLWYLAMLAEACDLRLDAIAAQNIAKLRARYPDGFSHTASQTRTEL